MANARGVGGVGTGSGVASPTLVIAGFTAGRSFLLGVVWNSLSNDPTSVTMTGEANLTPVGTVVRNTSLGGSCRWYKLDVLAGSGTKTITINFASAINCAFVGQEYSGTDTASFEDANNTATGNGANPSLSLTTIANNAGIIAICGTDGGKPTPGTGYTTFSMPNYHWFSEAEDDVDAGTAGAKTVNFAAASGQYILSAVSFKPAAAGGTFTRTASLNAAVLAAKAKSAGMTAALLAARTDAAAIDGALTLARMVQASLDGAAQGEAAKTAQIQAALRISRTATALLSAALRAGAAKTASLQAALKILRARTAGLDANLSAEGVATRSVELDAALQRALALSGGLDAGLAIALLRAVSTDAAIARRLTGAAPLQAALLDSVTLAGALDAVLGNIHAPPSARTFTVPGAGARTLVIPPGKRRH